MGIRFQYCFSEFFECTKCNNTIKRKVIDEAGNALQGVQIQFKDGENSAGRTKSQNNGEFSFVLKPGKTYSAMFDRSDILQSDINMTVPQFTSYQELQKRLL